MKVFQSIDSLEITRPVASIGMFDGVHLAHQSLIGKLLETSANLSGESVIVTFWPHPRILLNHNKSPIKLLNTLNEKIERLEKSGIENLIIIPFSRELAGMGFDTFTHEVLVNKIGIQHLVVGYNHQFGHNREGNYEKLQELSKLVGFGLSMLSPVYIQDTRVSSSVIRHLIAEGNMELANNLLGYMYSVSGKVVRGESKGRIIGFPTANISVGDTDKLLPPRGVYAVCAETDTARFKGMMNIGCRPTVSKDCPETVLEANLFDYEGDLYNTVVKISFVKRIRDERKFDTIEALRQQLLTDRQLINKILDSVKMTK